MAKNLISNKKRYLLFYYIFYLWACNYLLLNIYNLNIIYYLFIALSLVFAVTSGIRNRIIYDFNNNIKLSLILIPIISIILQAILVKTLDARYYLQLLVSIACIVNPFINIKKNYEENRNQVGVSTLSIALSSWGLLVVYDMKIILAILWLVFVFVFSINVNTGSVKKMFTLSKNEVCFEIIVICLFTFMNYIFIRQSPLFMLQMYTSLLAILIQIFMLFRAFKKN